MEGGRSSQEGGRRESRRQGWSEPGTKRGSSLAFEKQHGRGVSHCSGFTKETWGSPSAFRRHQKGRPDFGRMAHCQADVKGPPSSAFALSLASFTFIPSASTSRIGKVPQDQYTSPAA